MHETEVVLRIRVPLSSREAIQSPRLRLVLWAATPLRMHVTEAALRVGVPLSSGEAKKPTARTPPSKNERLRPRSG